MFLLLLLLLFIELTNTEPFYGNWYRIWLYIDDCGVNGEHIEMSSNRLNIDFGKLKIIRTFLPKISILALNRTLFTKWVAFQHICQTKAMSMCTFPFPLKGIIKSAIIMEMTLINKIIIIYPNSLFHFNRALVSTKNNDTYCAYSFSVTRTLMHHITVNLLISIQCEWASRKKRINNWVTILLVVGMAGIQLSPVLFWPRIDPKRIIFFAHCWRWLRPKCMP